MKQELLDLLEKKAYGFSYTEETVEYETRMPKPNLLCEKHKRLYRGAGFVSVKINKLKGEIVGVTAVFVPLGFKTLSKKCKFFKKS